MKIFPKSWPYLTKNNLPIHQRDLEELSFKIFDRFGNKSLEFGLELAYILLWGLSRADSIANLERAVVRLFSRIVRRKAPIDVPTSSKRIEQLSDDFVDASVLTMEERILLKESFSCLVFEGISIEELMEMDRSARHRIIKRVSKRNARYKELLNEH